MYRFVQLIISTWSFGTCLNMYNALCCSIFTPDLDVSGGVPGAKSGTAQAVPVVSPPTPLTVYMPLLGVALCAYNSTHGSTPLQLHFVLIELCLYRCKGQHLKSFPWRTLTATITNCVFPIVSQSKKIRSPTGPLQLLSHPVAVFFQISETRVQEII